MNLIKTIFFTLVLAVSAFAQAKACNDYSKKTEHSSQEKARIAELRKEIEILNQEKDKRLLELDIKYIDIERIIDQKWKECSAFNTLPPRKLYESPDITIMFDLIISVECKEVKKFVIEDRKNKVEKDSFYYDNGHWEVSERYWIKTETGESLEIHKSRVDGGGDDITIRDGQGRVTNEMYIDKNNDTLKNERYFWKNSRLVKTVLRGVERIFIYGTPCDSVIVEPPDVVPASWDFGRPLVYNKSFGLIPEEKDPEYHKFKMFPYGGYHITSELLERQKARCEEYKKSQRKKGNRK
jgi:hypothetical protein